jgi:GNAT superfamily N-acetyltransferase
VLLPEELILIVDNIIRDLGDGLILRRATCEDADAIAQFDGTIHRPAESTCVNEAIVALVRDLAVRPHPTCQASDFTLVEDTHSKQIVSSMCLINQTWTYAGIPFGVGRPELVGTLPEYRNRGLMRAQFEEVHRWSAERGHLLQAITGIPYYYRQFGYEYALALGGGRTGAAFQIPALQDGAEEPYTVRKAQVDDLPFLGQMYDLGCQRSLVACVRDQAVWRYELDGRTPGSDCCAELRVVETRSGQPIGFLTHGPHVQNGGVNVGQYELAPQASWLEVTPSVLRYIKTFGEGYTARKGQGSFTHYGFWLGPEHPIYQVIGSRLPNIVPSYAWYIRVSDLVAFIQLIAPVLEQRLAGSLAPDYSGEIKISFFRSGLNLVWENGKLVKVDIWRPSAREWGAARFPDLTFLQLVFGFHTIEELQQSFPDCHGGNDEVHLVLTALFPKMTSTIWPLE